MSLLSLLLNVMHPCINFFKTKIPQILEISTDVLQLYMCMTNQNQAIIYF